MRTLTPTPGAILAAATAWIGIVSPMRVNDIHGGARVFPAIIIG